MKSLLAFKILAGLLAAGLIAFCVIIADSFIPSFWVVWEELAGRVILLDLYIAMFLFGCWAIYRDGWGKGIAWMISFFILGSIGVVAHLLWSLRVVRKPADMARFFMGRHAAPAVVSAPQATAAPEKDRRRSSAVVPRPATV